MLKMQGEHGIICFVFLIQNIESGSLFTVFPAYKKEYNSMREFVIFGDSTCDLNKALREQYGIEYVSMNYVVDDQEYGASLDWENHPVHDFYNLMRDGKRVFTTQVPKQSYIDAFTAVLEAGKDILYISCSSALSGSIGTAQVVAQELAEKYPEASIQCVDSLISSFGQGHLLIEAAKCRTEGKSAAETAEYIKSIRLRMNQIATVGSMEYLRRAGRIKASKAFFGNLFGIKPIIISDTKGQNYAYKKVKGMNAAYAAIAQDVLAAADGVYETLYIAHADDEEAANAVKDAILAVAPFKNVVFGYIGPIVGASVGPGTVSAYLFGKEVTIEGND